MLLIRSQRHEDERQKSLFYKLQFNTRKNSARNYEFQECPTQEFLPRFMTGILHFDNQTCSFESYSECASRLKGTFDQWICHRKLCQNCSAFLEAKEELVNMLLGNLYYLPQNPNCRRGLIKSFGSYLLTVFSQMEQHKICVYAYNYCSIGQEEVCQTTARREQ